VGLAESAGAHALDERVDVTPLPAGLTALARLTARRTAVPAAPV
jgi:hypothetical protein